jgi:hypothetical protein
MAKFGLITYHRVYRRTIYRTFAQLPEYSINPAVKAHLSGKLKSRTEAELINELCQKAMRRLSMKEDIQGFETDCKFGEKEPPLHIAYIKKAEMMREDRDGPNT